MSDNVNMTCAAGDDLPPLCKLTIKSVRDADEARHKQVMDRLDTLTGDFGWLRSKLSNGISTTIITHSDKLEQLEKANGESISRIERMEKLLLGGMLFVLLAVATVIVGDYIRSPHTSRTEVRP
jgi:hypothetical protein